VAESEHYAAIREATAGLDHLAGGGRYRVRVTAGRRLTVPSARVAMAYDWPLTPLSGYGIGSTSRQPFSGSNLK